VQAYVNLGSVWDDLADQSSMANFAERRLREERLNNAEKMYRRALTFAPDDEKALCNLGALFMKRQKTSEAVTYFQKALAVNPKSALAHYNLAIAFAEAKIYREAIREWEAAAAADPKGDIGERSRANIEIVKDLLEKKVPEKVEGKKAAASN
jgi:tetratricopeptide (TPR) repeat protein